MATCTIWPFGLGCHYLGLCCTAYIGYNSVGIRRQEEGLYTKSKGEVIMPLRIVNWGKKIWSMFWTSCELISQDMGYDLFALLLTFSTYRLPEACLALFRASVWEIVFFLEHFSGQLGWTPWGKGFLLFLIIWFTPIHTRMSHPLGVSHSGGGEVKGCCLGGLYTL